MANLATAKVLYNITSATPLMYSDVTVTINCLALSAFSPRPAWITTQIAPGDGVEMIYVVTFEEPADLTNVIRGYAIVQGSESIVIDALNADSVAEACNACCGEGFDVAPYYTSGVPAFTYPVDGLFCIEAVDAGDSSAFETFNLKYIAQILGGGEVYGRASGVTSYNVKAFGTPIAVGADIVTAGACS